MSIAIFFGKHFNRSGGATRRSRTRGPPADILYRKDAKKDAPSVAAPSLWRSKRQLVQVQLRSTRSHVRGHYRRNYHVASTPDAFQLRGIGEARRDERRPFQRAKNRARRAVCVTYRRGYLHEQREIERGGEGEVEGRREPAYRFICILVCRCKSFNYVHHKSRHGPSVCSCAFAFARVCSRPSSAPPPGSTPVHTLGGLFCDEKRDTLGGR